MDVIACMKERQVALRRATRHVLAPVAKSIVVDGGIFENVLHQILYQLCSLNNNYLY
jgi:hypothetical protein